MRLRNFQLAAANHIVEAFVNNDAALAVMPTGTGKSILLAEVIRRVSKRAIVIAHREELIFQNANKIKSITGEEVGIEMAEYRASATNLYGKHKVIVATIQTLNAGNNGDGRMAHFDPDDFDLLAIDEAHHAVAESYRNVIRYFRQNKKLKVLGLTATPDRADEAALGQIFQTVAFNYEIVQAIDDGWLVPVDTQAVVVDGIDLSNVRTTAGDLNGADLSRIMEYEKNLHEVATPAFEIIGTRKALVFAASVAQAQRLAEIFNRHEANCANWVCGETPKEDRRRMFADYAAKKFRILVNVGVATEGFDDPSIEVVAVARPTKSRSLYAQMLGRGTRPLPGIVDHPDGEGLYWTADHRRAAIASSSKPSLLVLDFVGNSGRHKLVTAADILGGKHSDDVIARAQAKVKEAGAPVNVLDALEEAEEDARKERDESRIREESQRASFKPKVRYTTAAVDAFDIFGIAAPREYGWDKGRQPSEKQLALLEKQGVKTADLSYAQSQALIGEITRRWDEKLCSFKQSRILANAGYPTDVSREQASVWIDQIFKKGKTNTPEREAALAGIKRY